MLFVKKTSYHHFFPPNRRPFMELNIPRPEPNRSLAEKVLWGILRFAMGTFNWGLKLAGPVFVCIAWGLIGTVLHQLWRNIIPYSSPSPWGMSSKTPASPSLSLLTPCTLSLCLPYSLCLYLSNTPSMCFCCCFWLRSLLLLPTGRLDGMWNLFGVVA